jgi:hypothetical protein
MEEKYQEGLANNQDPYGRACYTFAERWAKLLEKDIEETGNAKTAILTMAKKRSHEADTEGITGFMYGAAVNILSNCWLYGEILRKWHNKEYNYEGEGVVNPAILTIGSM